MLDQAFQARTLRNIIAFHTESSDIESETDVAFAEDTTVLVKKIMPEFVVRMLRCTEAGIRRYDWVYILAERKGDSRSQINSQART
jgi:hypothetical protein